MNITVINKSRENGTLFRDLTTGTIFCIAREITPYMKTKPFISGETLKPCNGIRLADGILCVFDEALEVEELDARVVIEK